jgi:hypothetical protein
MATPTDQYRRLAPQQRRLEGLSGGIFAIAALLTCAFGVGVVVAGYFWLHSAPPQVSQAVLSATGEINPAAVRKPVDNGSWTDEDIKNCSDQANAAAENAKRRKLAAVSSDRVGLGGPDADTVQRATYLLCGSTHKRLHLCQSYWHEWYMQAIKEHAADFETIATSAYWTKVDIAEQARRQANGQKWKTVTDDLDQTTREIGKMHDDITGAFRSLITDGIIDPADFGVFFGMGIAPNIAAMIGNARPARHLCG